VCAPPEQGAALIPYSILKLGVVIKRVYFPELLPRQHGFGSDFERLYKTVRPYTMTTWERLYGAYQAIEYVMKNGIQGSIVECGVWKGGSSMMMALALQHFGDTSREMYLFDTFAGMTPPTEADGSRAQTMWAAGEAGPINTMCYSSLAEVKANMLSTGYPPDRIHFVQGAVEKTIPGTIPGQIAVLRLDTDWYESTYHELTHLYPRLARHGTLIIDDYGDWEGARRAVDQYFGERSVKPLLSRIDPTGRLAIKID
jgi:O-methyltransferase